MPLKPGGSRAVVSQNIREFHTGPTYRHTAVKFGKARANKQAIAVALNNARKYAEGGAAPKPILESNPDWLPRVTQPAADNSSIGVRAVPRDLRDKFRQERGYAAGGSPPPLTPDSPRFNPDSPTGRFPTRSPRPEKMALGGPDINMENMVMRGSMYGLRREGMINSAIPGRTDKLPMSVKSGSYVLPADIPSALGQGNSMAGGVILKKMFSSGPYGLGTMRGAGRTNMPRMNFVKPPSMGMGKKMPFAEGGPIEPGNIDLHDRPVVNNPDGSISTVRSMSIDEGGHSVLIPTVVNGRIVSDDEAISHYHNTGEHLGIFKDFQSADEYARKLHEDQAGEYLPKKRASGGRGTKREQPGGAEQGMDESVDHVPIIAAGGEYIIDPVVVRHIGHGDIKAGHRVLDKFVLNTRKKHIDTLKKLKPPKK